MPRSTRRCIELPHTVVAAPSHRSLVLALCLWAGGACGAMAAEIPALPEVKDPAAAADVKSRFARRAPAGRPRLRDDNCGLPTSKAPVPVTIGRSSLRAVEHADSFDAGPGIGRVRTVGHTEEVPADEVFADEVPAAEVSTEVSALQPPGGLMPMPEGRIRFKQIREILPYEDYEPDPEVAAKDRCNNLCPRGPNCPECKQRNGEVGSDTLICPACPKEEPVPGQDRSDLPLHAYPNRSFAHIDYCWEPSNMYHLPLYFEDFCLERYGHTRHYLLQPVVSTSIFAVQLLGLPYQASIDPIWKKRYTLGWHRPGKFVPYKYYQVPWNTQAAATQAAFVTGGYFLFAPSVSP
jgi:hypothetical protein